MASSRPALLVSLLAAALPVLASPAGADEPNQEVELTWGQVFGQRFRSSRLFEVPVARVVGAYRMSLSYDGSLLAEPGVLSSAGVFAIGFGDIAQLEYRHTSAITIDGGSAPLPSAGVQFKVPVSQPGWPELAVAFRVGVNRSREVDDATVSERASDGYLVTLYQPPFLSLVTVHAGARVTRASIEISGPVDHEEGRYLVLPAAGLEVQMNEHTRLTAEWSLSPQFDYSTATPDAPPSIGSANQGRLGVRWALLDALTLDASLGYRFLGADSTDQRGLFRWDIRLGGEVHIPWDAIACKGLALLCGRHNEQQ